MGELTESILLLLELKNRFLKEKGLKTKVITMSFEKLNDKIHIFKDENFYDAIVGAIELPTQLIMFDTGTHIPRTKEFREKLEKETGKKFTIAILSHYHGDHTLGNQLFSDCRIIANQIIHDKMKSMQERWDEKVIQQMKDRLEDKTALDGLKITLPNEVLDKKLTIEDEGVKVIIEHTGGHTSCSSHIYCPNYSVLFAGDNLFEGNYLYGGDPTCNPEIWLQVLNQYLDLNAKYYVPGHGKVTDKTTIEETIDYITQIKEFMIKLHDEKISKDEILTKAYDIDFYPYDENNEHDVMLKKSTLERWFNVWIENKI